MVPSKSVSPTPGIIGPVQRAELQLNELSVRCSILLSFRKVLPAVFWFFTESFSVHQNPESYFQKRTARLSPAVQVREKTPWGAATGGELSLISFCRSKRPAH
jgi:hypothetical protein